MAEATADFKKSMARHGWVSVDRQAGYGTRLWSPGGETLPMLKSDGEREGSTMIKAIPGPALYGGDGIKRRSARQG